jgi:hypothetical protein
LGSSNQATLLCEPVQTGDLLIYKAHTHVVLDKRT